ncbi:MAG TPA: DUF5939 domain-containing protein [Chthonomonadaceae bacterium]|nr:DUF5939 domain-containing protein [Chthonomonadaceae bacterium]
MRLVRTMRIAAPRERVWELMADTERLNREVGLPSIRYEFLPRATGGTEMFGTVQVGPVSVRYRELPFEWVRPDFHSVRRLFESGPIRETALEFRLREEEGATRVDSTAVLVPRHFAASSFVRVVGEKLMRDLTETWKTFEAYLVGQAETPYPRHSRQPPVDRERLQRAVAALRQTGAEAQIVSRLADYLAHAPPEDVTTIRPFALADAWGWERLAVLKTFLRAASREVGLLELRWRLLCPSCRGAAPENTSLHLGDIRAEVHCPSCNIRFDADFDKSVEVCFAVAPGVRPVREVQYCRGGPWLTPHVCAQLTLEAGKTRTLPICLPPGRYALVSPQAAGSIPFCVENAGDDGSKRKVCAAVKGQAGQAALVLPETAVGRQAEWTLANHTEEPVLLHLESQEPGVPVATAALVTTLQAFRDQFSSEVLSPGVEVAVRQICVLFSDLKGSTAMYRQRGDAPSYRLVRDHFEAMRRIIADHDGALVKTIGDAVMAAFADPAHGLAAAIAIQKEARALTDPLIVKLGLHSGPTIAINANGLLDYFGQTVNLAARLQSQSQGEDIVIAADLAQDARVAEVLRANACHLEPFTQTVRGLDAPLAMLCVTLPDEELSAGV